MSKPMFTNGSSDGADVRTATLQHDQELSGDSSTKSRPIDGRYQLLERLGAGGMATVHRARDLQKDRDIAIKFMKSDLGGSARRRFFREFNTIAGIDHPCCLRVYEIGETEEAPYFTMELHPGDAVTSVFGESPADLAPMLIDLTLAIDYIHSQGIVHRDIKPSNVLVQRQGGHDDRRINAKLADFGLAKFYQLDSSLTAERGLVGTPAYCAPEQIDGGQIDHRVDLYAIGIMAYELLSGGIHPFATQRQQGVSALLQAQLSASPPALVNQRYPLPDSVATVVASYLAKDSEQRPDSAVALRRALADAFGIEVESRLEQLSTPSAVRLNALGFVCREAELDVADQFLQSKLQSADKDALDTLADQSNLMVISGEPGAGKSSLMQEVSRRALGKGCRVYDGRCFDGNASPFQPFIEIIRQILSSLKHSKPATDESTMLVDNLSRQVDEAKKIESILLDYRQELLRVAPELRRWLPGDALEPAVRNDADYMIRALATMLIEISQTRPLCLCFDDIQWADQSTLALLQHLAAALPRHTPRPELVLVCTGRSGYDQLSSFLAKSESRYRVTTIDLAVFGPTETRQMLALRLGCLPGQIDQTLINSVDSLCHGNPFFISETVREWYSRGLIARTTDGWKLVRQNEDDSSLPTSVRGALRGRVNELAETSQSLLPVAAAIGRVVDLDLLTAVVPQVSETDLLDAVDELLTKRILVETNTASRLEFSHDLMRELILAELTGSRRLAIHRRIADVMEQQLSSGSRVASNALLAMHFQSGEMPDKAFHYSVKAGGDALRAYAFDDALEQLKRAEEVQPDNLGKDASFEFNRLFAEAWAGVGRLENATKAGESALASASTRIEKARMLAKLAWFRQKRGETTEARDSYDQALNALGLSRTKRLPFVLLSTQVNLFLFHFVPTPIVRWCLRRRLTEDQLPELLCEIYFELAYLLGSRDLFRYLQVCALNAATSRLTSSPNGKCLALSKYGLNLGFSGVTFLSSRYAKQALQWANSDSRPEVAGIAKGSVAACLHFAGRLQEAEQLAQEAAATLSRCGDHHASMAYHWLRHIHSVYGVPEKIITTSQHEIEVATKTSDKELIGYGYYGLAHGLALNGQFERAIEAGEESIRLLKENQSAFVAISHIELGFALMQASRYTEAVESLKTAISTMNKYLHYFEIHMPVFPRLTEALLGPTWHDAATIHPQNIREAKRYARRAKIFSMIFPNIRPHTLRVLGRLHFARGETQKARKYFDQAIVAAEKLGAQYDLARSLYDSAVAFPDQTDHRQSALQLLDEIAAVMPIAERTAN